MKSLFSGIVTCLALTGAWAQPFALKEGSSYGARSDRNYVTSMISAQEMKVGSTPSQEDPRELRAARWWQCDTETLSADVWLFSHHMGKHSRDLNEKNRGLGLVYTCNGWSGGFDRMVNSNRGQATVTSLVYGMRLVTLGPVFLNGNVGFARVSYEVPRYNVTLYENTPVAFVGVGLTQFPKLVFNVSKVPKTAGRAYITWIKYEIWNFK